jgi:hypothetical protein
MTDTTTIQDATPERLAKTNGALPTFNAAGARILNDSLLERLADKGQLYPDAGINAVLKQAGERYYADWYGAGMSTLIAIDYGKVQGGGGGANSGIPVGRIQTQCRDSYRAARKALTPKYRKAVEAILIEGQSDLVGVGKALSGAASPHTCRAVAIERFTAGLLFLAKHYAFLK